MSYSMPTVWRIWLGTLDRADPRSGDPLIGENSSVSMTPA